jgi:predicted ATP-grasp superfamily ATP-dependent carboligase
VTADRPVSVVVASAAYAGTLAAVRDLGARGFEVVVMSGPRLSCAWSPRVSAAAWSRYASRTYRAPQERDNEHFVAELLRIGAKNPGQVLLPTSDETAWMYTVHAAELGRYFRLLEPPLAAMQKILDKQQFASAAIAAGVRVVPSWEVHSLAELAEKAHQLPYPLLIKPRTHVNRIRNDKGVLVNCASELLAEYPRFLEREQGATDNNPLLPDAPVPILQQFVRVSVEGVCSVTGYIDRSGELFVTRRSTKVLQRSMPAGVGICFESLPPDAALSDAVRRLCRELGYFGIFEVEFVYCDGDWAVIDFNPRTFNQIGMDIRRGMPLPFFACLEAVGDRDALRAAIRAAQDPRADDTGTVFCDHFTLHALLLARALTCRNSRGEISRWRDWLRAHAGNCVDVAAAVGDPLPKFVHVVSEILVGLRGFRRFLRLTPRTDRAGAVAISSHT